MIQREYKTGLCFNFTLLDAKIVVNKKLSIVKKGVSVNRVTGIFNASHVTIIKIVQLIQIKIVSN